MKLLTINSHSLQERHYVQKLEWFVDAILKEKPDLLAIQEASQSMIAPPITETVPDGYVPPSEHQILLREDNYAAQVAIRLHAAGVSCSWTWLPIKRGYSRFDEGLALISLGRPIAEVDVFLVSGCADYYNWRTRKALGIRLNGGPDWFYNVHLGWWNDEQEPFRLQWTILERKLAQKKKQGPVWLLGDFNAPAEIRDEGYDYVTASGWHDTYLLADQKEGGVTVRGSIDGWCTLPDTMDGLRIDQIWCSESLPVTRSRVIFDGINSPVISDHFGLMVETGLPRKKPN